MTGAGSGGAARASTAMEASRRSRQRQAVEAAAGRTALVVAVAPIGIMTQDADGDRRCQPRPCGAATADAMMTMAGERGDEATARRLQGNDEAARMQRQSAMAPQVAGTRRESTRG